MLKKIPKTLSLGLSGLLGMSLGLGSVGINAVHADTSPRRVPNVLHEMVPHIVLPETIQYNKTAKNLPGNGYNSVTSPNVGTYVAYPSYQVPHSTSFRSVGQSVYPVSPQVAAPLAKTQSDDSTVQDNMRAAEAMFAEQSREQDIVGRDVVLNQSKATRNIEEPIQLASSSEEQIPQLPRPNHSASQTTIVQTGMFCHQPAKPPSAWAFSSPLFKVASVPAPWSGQHTGSITHHSPRGSSQHVGFAPTLAQGEPGTLPQSEPGAFVPGFPAPMGMPYSTVQRGRGVNQHFGSQVQMLPNGMLLLTMPPTHHNCGPLRCRASCLPKTVLLPPAGHFQQPQMMPQGTPQSMIPGNIMYGDMMYGNMMPGHTDMPFMQVSQPMMPVHAMTPMGPAIVGYQQVPMMNPMSMPQQIPAEPSPMVASQVQEQDVAEQPSLVATPFGYAVRVPADALQSDVAAQLVQMQQALTQMQIQMQMQSMQIPANPYAGLYATPFGYVAMNQSAGQFGPGQSMMIPNMMPQQGGMSVSDMLQIMAFINSNKPAQQRRQGLFARMAERREARKAECDDLVTQLMQAWTTPYAAADTTLRMPASNAYPYGYFGVQSPPINSANYGGFHNLYYGNTAYPGLY